MANKIHGSAHGRVDVEPSAEADQWLREAIATLNDGIAIYDADGAIAYFNESFLRINGYERADLVPGVTTYDDLGRFDPTISNDDHTPLAFAKCVAMLRRDGAQVAVQRRANGIYERRQFTTPSGGLISVLSDITRLFRLKTIQETRNKVLELLAKGRNLDVVLTSLVEGCEALNPEMLGSVLVLDETGTHLLLGAAPSLPKFYNEAIHGIEIGEGVGSCGTAAHNSERVIVADIATHPYWAGYKELAVKAELSACWSQPIFSTAGKVLGTFAMYYKECRAPTEDDLEFINGSAHLAGIAIETHQTETARKAALRKAEQASKAKSEFLATLSHEFRTPLNAVIGFSEMMKGPYASNLTPERAQEYSADIYNSAMHLLSLVTDVLDISSIEAGNRKLVKDMFDIKNVLQDCERSIAKQADEGGIKLSCEIPDILPPLYADKRAVTQIVLNLLSNAVKFTEPNGVIILSARADADYTIVEVQDTGIGIHPERLPVITEPFSQGNTDPYKTQLGTGLGLSIVKSLVEAHKGTLSIESTVGVGTTATVTFPVLDD